MSIRHILRRSSAVLAFAAATVLIPAAVEAACNESYNPVTRIETYTCCGSTACCTTRWQGTTLISNSCRG